MVADRSQRLPVRREGERYRGEEEDRGRTVARGLPSVVRRDRLFLCCEEVTQMMSRFGNIVTMVRSDSPAIDHTRLSCTYRNGGSASKAFTSTFWPMLIAHSNLWLNEAFATLMGEVRFDRLAKDSSDGCGTDHHHQRDLSRMAGPLVFHQRAPQARPSTR